MITIEIHFIKDIGWKVLDDETKEEFTKEAEIPVHGEIVKWTLEGTDKKGESEVVNGILQIKNVEMPAEITLALNYEILGIKRAVKIQHTAESKEGKPLILKQYFIGHTIQADFIDVTDKGNLPVGNEKVECGFQKDADVVLDNGQPSFTDAKGVLLLRNIRLPEKKPAMLFYKIRNNNASKELSFYDTKNSRSRIFSLAKLKQFVSITVRIKHTGKPDVLELARQETIKWSLYKVEEPAAVVPVSKTEEESSPDSLSETLPPPLPTRKEPAKKVGDPIRSGASPLAKGDFLEIPQVAILNKEKLMLSYYILGQEKNVLLERTTENDSDSPLLKPVKLSNTTIKIEFLNSRENPTPIADAPIDWTLKGEKVALKINDPAAKYVNGTLTIDNIPLPEGGHLNFWYKTKEKEKDISIVHTNESKNGEPLVVKQYLTGTTIYIDFKGTLDVAKKPVAYKLAKSATEVKSETDETGRLEIKNVDITETQSLDFDYQIFDTKRILKVRHTEESKKGKPLTVVQYLTGIPITVTFVKEEDGKTPISNQAITWKLTGSDGLEKTKTVIPKTDETGKLTLENISIEDQQSLTFTYDILGEKGSDTFAKFDLEAVRTDGFTGGLKTTISIFALEDITSIKNPERHWLTYESLFNKAKFRKPSCEFKLSLFLIPVNDVLIWLRDDLSKEHLQTFVNSFFPDFTATHLEDLANDCWSWKKKGTDFWILDMTKKKNDVIITANIVFTPTLVNANRATMKIYKEPYVVLPYNRFDNTGTSNALATKNPDGNLLKVKEEKPYLWSGWKTASRSCIVQLPNEPVKKAGDLWKTGKDDSIAGDFKDWKFDETHRQPLFEEQQTGAYNLKKTNKKQDFSLKTGVQFIGKDFQGGYKHKDVIGDWLIGCLRSDYINYIDKKLAPPKDGLLILTELITITEKKIRQHPDAKGVAYREGIQVRDISILDEKKIYLAPLNIPFLDLEFKEFKNEFLYFRGNTTAAVEEIGTWKEFWKHAFAAALGRTKALTLLRYGLQIVNPNQQNFLIEFEEADGKIKPTGNLVIRDLNDASIHRQVVWALCDGPGLPPPDSEKDTWKHLSKIEVPVIKFEFTDGRMKKEGFGNQDPQETGTKIEGQDFGPPGTQFLWQRFSAFVNLNKGADVQKDPVLSHPKNKDIATETYKNLLITMADWGMAHNKSYISCVEQHLGKNFREINWLRCPNPSRYKNFTTITNGKVDITPTAAEKSSQNPALEITGFFQGNLSEENKKLLETQLNLKLPEIKEIFEKQPCLEIRGKGFAEKVIIELGTTKINSDFVISTPTKLFVCNKAEMQIKGIIDKKAFITIRNPDLLNQPAIYKFVNDPNYLTEIEWEEASAKVIHEFLANAEGQAALRKCRDRKWTLIAPLFTVRLSDIDKKPFAWKRVFMTDTKTNWSDLTDEKGEIKIYQGSIETIKICPQTDEMTTEAPVWLECKSHVWESISITII